MTLAGATVGTKPTSHRSAMFFLNNIFIILYEYMLVIEHRKNTRNVLLLLFAGPSESKRYSRVAAAASVGLLCHSL